MLSLRHLGGGFCYRRISAVIVIISYPFLDSSRAMSARRHCLPRSAGVKKQNQVGHIVLGRNLAMVRLEARRAGSTAPSVERGNRHAAQLVTVASVCVDQNGRSALRAKQRARPSYDAPKGEGGTPFVVGRDHRLHHLASPPGVQRVIEGHARGAALTGKACSRTVTLRMTRCNLVLVNCSICN
jgi:hypothetical protein